MKRGKPGIFITLEGGEGCGKSTQIERLERRLKKLRHRVLRTREPGGTPVGDSIRKVLLDARYRGMSPICETMLYMASRAQLVEQVIRPALAQGRVVLCDRWLDATEAYQGYAGGVDPGWIRSLGEAATGGLKPHLSIYLDLSPEAGLRRARKRGKPDRMERKKLTFHRKVRRGFLAIVRREGRRFKRVAITERDGIEAVEAKVWKEVARVLR